MRVVLQHSQLSEYLVAKLFTLFGVDNVYFRKMNKEFYENRKCKEVQIVDYVVSFLKIGDKYYVKEVGTRSLMAL